MQQQPTGVVLATDTRLRPRICGSFPKAQEIVETVDSGLRGLDRRVLNIILAHSREALKEDPNRLFHARCSYIRRQLGWDRHNDNSAIFDSLYRLQKTIVTIGYLSHGNYRRNHINLLIETDVPEREGVVYWRFNPKIAGLLGDPKHFARIFLDVVASLASDASLRLYENLALYSQRGDGMVEYKVEDLRNLLNVANAYERWADFNRKVLRPALEEVNEKGPFRAKMKYVRTGRRIDAVRFYLSPSDSWIEPPQNVPERRPLPPPGKVRALAARVQPSVLARLAEEYPKVDMQRAVHMWADDFCRRKLEVKRPGKSLESWLRTFGPALSAGIEEAELLWGIATLYHMNPNHRRLWLNAASPEIKKNVPNAQAENIYLWCESILDDLMYQEGFDQLPPLGTRPGSPLYQPDLFSLRWPTKR